jgi:hypothetical protein
VIAKYGRKPTDFGAAPLARACEQFTGSSTLPHRLRALRHDRNSASEQASQQTGSQRIPIEFLDTTGWITLIPNIASAWTSPIGGGQYGLVHFGLFDQLHRLKRSPRLCRGVRMMMDSRSWRRIESGGARI